MVKSNFTQPSYSNSDVERKNLVQNMTTRISF